MKHSKPTNNTAQSEQYKVPDFDLPIIIDDTEQSMAPKPISFDAYLRVIASSYKSLSNPQKEHYRKLKLAVPPVPVRFEI